MRTCGRTDALQGIVDRMPRAAGIDGKPDESPAFPRRIKGKCRYRNRQCMCSLMKRPRRRPMAHGDERRMSGRDMSGYGQEHTAESIRSNSKMTLKVSLLSVGVTG